MRLAVLLALLALTACQRTEEERLRAQIDTIKTHLYLGAKVALVAREPTPQILAARKALQFTRTGTVTAAQVAATAVALYQLRGLGKDELEHGRTSELTPFVPALFGLTSTAAPGIDTNVDHFILLLAAAGFKFHPKSPLPVPNEILVYEAWMTDASRIPLPTMSAWGHSLKGYVFATNTYCSLAKQETDAVAAMPDLLFDLSMLNGMGPMVAHVPEAGGVLAAIIVIPFVTRALAHGATAMCFLERKDDVNADIEIARFVDLCERIGVPPEDLAIIRAYLAYKKGDLAGTRDFLREAKKSHFVEDNDQKEIDGLIEHLEEDRGAFAEYFDQAFFVHFFAKIAWAKLEPVARDALAEARMFEPLRALLTWVAEKEAETEEAWKKVGCGG